MLKVSALASAMPVVANLEARGLYVKPIAGTPLANLVDASDCNLEYAWSRSLFAPADSMLSSDDKYEIQVDIIANATNRMSTVTGYCEQDIALAEVADVAATAVVAHLAHARTVVMPAIEGFVNQLSAPLMQALSDSIGDMEIIPCRLPAPMLESAVVEAFMKSKDVMGDNLQFALSLPVLDKLSIVALMKSGSPSVDQAIEDWVDTLPVGFIEKTWIDVFTMSPSSVGSTPSANTVFSRTPEGLNAALLVFLIARRIWDKPIEDVAMTLDNYQSKMADVRNQAAVRLVGEISLNERNEKYGTLVRSQGMGKISVNEVVYRKFLSDGGSNELLMGNALSDQPLLSADDIIKDADRLKQVWQNYLAYNNVTLANRRFTTAKSLVRVEFAAWVAAASVEELPINDRNTVMQRFNEALELTTQREVQDLYSWVQRLLCKSVYYKSDAGVILDSINAIMAANPSMNVHEAATVAAIDYTATWVGRQLQLQPAKM